MGAVSSVNFDESKQNYYKQYGSQNKDTIYLEERIEAVKNEQGVLGNFWNGFKELTTLGTSASDCESMLEKYKSGEISFEEAVEYIDSFENKQKSATGLMSNILTGIGSIAASVALYSNPATMTAAMALKAGAPIGALLKSGINLIDRASNNIEGDEFNAKTIIKDAISGAITGTTSAVSSGVGEGIKNAKFGLSVKNGIKCGLACGAASGAGSYLTDVAFDEDKHFDFDELAAQTATSALISGTVGGVVGAGMYGISDAITHTAGQQVSRNTAKAIIDDSASSSTRKILGQLERNIVTA